MSYPPDWRVANDPDAVLLLMRTFPFAHLNTASDGLHCTRTPFVTDSSDGRPVHLRAHINARNPQAQRLRGQEALVVFDGPATYVSPHWRTDRTRAATYDYEQVQVRGIVHVIDDIDFFRRLIDDLAAMIEPHHAEAGDYPVWQTAMTPPGYVERLYPAITAFRLEVTAVRMISKLHQTFPEADRHRIADHLDKLPREQSRAIARRIRSQMNG